MSATAVVGMLFLTSGIVSIQPGTWTEQAPCGSRFESYTAHPADSPAARTDPAGLVDGWPVFLDPPGGGFPYTVTLFDMDGDGADEIFLTGGETFGLNGSGEFLPGWPTSEMQYMGYGTNDQKPGPSCADIDGDGICEIMWSERDWYAGSSYMWSFNGRHEDGSNMEGFPQEAPDGFSNALDSPFVLGDADGDGNLEAWSAHTLGNNFVYYRISGFASDGTKLFTTDLDADENIVNVYFGDVDGNGQEEFFAIALLSGVFRLHAFTPEGDEQAGYPRDIFTSVGTAMFGKPIPVDLDADEDLEFIFGYYTATATANARHHDGTQVTGFPITISSNTQLLYLGLGDVTADGFPELIATGKMLPTPYAVWAIDLATGSALSGWPAVIPGWPGGYPTAVDVDDDGHQDICCATDGGQLYAIDHAGAIIPGYPKTLDGPAYSGVAAGDIDGDGLYELVAVSTTGWAYAWDTDGVVAPGRADWPMRGIDERYTGVFHIGDPSGTPGGGGAPEMQPVLLVLQNPAGPSVEFIVEAGAGSELAVYDFSGREVGIIGVEGPGSTTWAPGAGAPPGVYFAVLRTADRETASASFVLLD